MCITKSSQFEIGKGSLRFHNRNVPPDFVAFDRCNIAHPLLLRVLP